MVIALVSILTAAQAAGNASLAISPLSGSYKVGQTFNVAIFVDPGGDTIDSVRARLSYPPDLLEIKNFTFGSAFSFQAGGNGFDNNSGTFSYGAGVAGGTAQGTNFGTITFSVKAPGQAQITLGSDSLVLAAGENKYNGSGVVAVFALAKAAAATTPAKDVPKQTAPATEEPAAQTPVPQDTNAEPLVLPPSQQGVAAIDETSSHIGFIQNNLILLTALGVLVIALVGGITWMIKKKKRAATLPLD